MTNSKTLLSFKQKPIKPFKIDAFLSCFVGSSTNAEANFK